MTRRFQFSLRALLGGWRDPPISAAAARITLFSLAICSAASVATVAIVIHEGKPKELGWFLYGGAIAGWAISPYVGLAALALLTKRKIADAIVTAGATTILVLFAAWTMIDALFVHTHSTSPLVLIFVPLWQWSGVTMVAAVLGGTATINWLRGRPQFSLWSLLMVMLCVAVVCGLLRFMLQLLNIV